MCLQRIVKNLENIYNNEENSDEKQKLKSKISVQLYYCGWFIRKIISLYSGNPKFKHLAYPYYLRLIKYLNWESKYSNYMVVQAHPPYFKPERLEEFKKVIEFLIREGCEFVLPYEYFKTIIANPIK